MLNCEKIFERIDWISVLVVNAFTNQFTTYL